LETLLRREEPNLLASDRVCDGLLVCKVSPLDVDLGDSLNAPADAKITLLLFPVLGEDDTPKCAEDAVDGGEVT
jgi:hypothetical protein